MANSKSQMAGAVGMVENPQSSAIRHQLSAIGSWRLLRHGPATGAENMAIDEAITMAIAEGLAPPTLRFYAWAPPCVSMGRNQKSAEVDAGRCAARGYGIVRRPTGGRAILHTDELTYSIIASPDHPLMAGLVLDSYLRLSAGLVAGLTRLGIAAEPAPGTSRPGPDVSAACFEVPSAYEIVAGTRKVLGSAQARRARSVLQHGSLPLTGDLTRVVDCLTFADEAERETLRRSLHGHAATAEELAGRPISYAEAEAAMIAGFGEALALDLAPGELTDAERTWAAELVRDRYGNAEWAARV
jgi:lipoate-protein ligase A